MKELRIARRRVRAALAPAAISGAVVGLVDALLIESRRIKVTSPSVRLAGLPPAWDGVRIANLTDLHHGRIVRLGPIAEAVRLANAESPDLIVLTGDFVSRPGAITNALSDVLAELKAPLGKLAVLGNHDHWAGAAAVREMLSAAGVHVLANDHVSFRRGNETLTVAGVDDLWAGLPDIGQAMQGAPFTGARLLLAHNPAYALKLPPWVRLDLMIAGHTHGGQLRLPFTPRQARTVRRIRSGSGLIRSGTMPVHISRGIGMVGLPLRVNCRAELPIITLKTGTRD